MVGEEALLRVKSVLLIIQVVISVVQLFLLMEEINFEKQLLLLIPKPIMLWINNIDSVIHASDSNIDATDIKIGDNFVECNMCWGHAHAI